MFLIGGASLTLHSRTHLDVVLWFAYVGMEAVGFPPVHKINLGRLTQDVWKHRK